MKKQFSIALLGVIAMHGASAGSFTPLGKPSTYDAGIRCAVPQWSVADFNRDGRRDVVLGLTASSNFTSAATTGELMIWNGQADGSLKEQTALSFTGSVTSAYGYTRVIAGDLNGDGVPDIFVADQGIDTYANGVPVGPWLGATPKMALSNGTALVDRSNTLSTLPLLFAHSAAIADINRDGNLDLYIGSISAGTDRTSYLLINDGRGNFTRNQSRLPTRLTVSGSSPLTPQTDGSQLSEGDQFTGSIFVDHNNDGAPDLIVLPSNSTSYGLILTNDGAGDFSKSTPLKLPAGLYGAGWTKFKTNPDNSVTITQGPGTVFLDAVAIDINSDGYQDLIVVETIVDPLTGIYYRGGKLQILINQRGAGFVDETASRGAPGFDTTINYDSYHGTLTVADVNGDGYPDIVAVRVAPSFYETHVFLNDGKGKFQRATVTGLPTTGFLVPISRVDEPIRIAHFNTVNRRLVPWAGSQILACDLAVQVYQYSDAPLIAGTGLWWHPAESGWGINFNQQGNTLFGTLFTYDQAGKPLWLVMSNGQRQQDGNTFLGDLFQTTGPAFNATPFTPITAANVTKVGSMSVAFSSPTSANLGYSFNGVTVSKAIQPQVFGTRSAPCLAAQSTRTALTNFQDLWWNPAESGWGVNIAHQDNTLFATLFTYDATGKALWLVMSAGVKQTDGSYLGDLFQSTGSAFNAQPFTPIGSTNIARVGTMRFRFNDGVSGTLDYSINGVSVSKSIVRQEFSAPLPACSS